VSLRFVGGGFEFQPDADAIPFISGFFQLGIGVLGIVARLESALDCVSAHFHRLLLDTSSGVEWPVTNNHVMAMLLRALLQ
jgi:hypothetical protein